MPRIRTIKPDFFTNSRTGTLSGQATKLFVGMWGHADDYGVIGLDLEELKAKILPYDKGSVDEAVRRPLVDELLRKGLVVHFVVADPEKARRGLDEGSARTSFLWIPSFLADQKVDRPSQPLIAGWTAESTPFTCPSAVVEPLAELETAPVVTAFDEGSTSPLRGLAQERRGEERSNTQEPPLPPQGAVALDPIQPPIQDEEEDPDPFQPERLLGMAVMTRARLLDQGCAEILRRPLHGAEWPLPLEWAQLKRDDAYVPVEEILECVRHKMAIPCRDGTLSGSLRWAANSVDALRRQAFDPRSLSRPRRRHRSALDERNEAIDRRVYELMGGDLEIEPPDLRVLPEGGAS